MEKGRKYLSTVTLKTEHTVLLCADVEYITINSKGSCGMWQSCGNLFPCVCLVIYLIDTAITYTVNSGLFSFRNFL